MRILILVLLLSGCASAPVYKCVPEEPICGETNFGFVCGYVNPGSRICAPFRKSQ